MATGFPSGLCSLRTCQNQNACQGTPFHPNLKWALAASRVHGRFTEPSFLERSILCRSRRFTQGSRERFSRICFQFPYMSWPGVRGGHHERSWMVSWTSAEMLYNDGIGSVKGSTLMPDHALRKERPYRYHAAWPLARLMCVS